MDVLALVSAVKNSSSNLDEALNQYRVHQYNRYLKELKKLNKNFSRVKWIEWVYDWKMYVSDLLLSTILHMF